MAFAIHPENRLSLADLEAMPEDGYRYELLGGAIVMTPSPVTGHQRAVVHLLDLLRSGCPPDHEVFIAPIDLDLADDQRAVPDLVVIPTQNINEKRLVAPALLVVEVVSPGSRINDYGTKVQAYGESAVAHYWIIDPNRERVVAYRLPTGGGEYELVLDQTGGEVVLVDPIGARFTVSDLTKP
jgi:Uma2 family endonuclease